MDTENLIKACIRALIRLGRGDEKRLIEILIPELGYRAATETAPRLYLVIRQWEASKAEGKVKRGLADRRLDYNADNLERLTKTLENATWWDRAVYLFTGKIPTVCTETAKMENHTT